MGMCFGKTETAVTKDLSSNQQNQRVISQRQVKATNAQQMSDQDRITLDLKKVQDNLNKRLQQVDKGMKEAHEQAKEFVRQKNKVRAKFALEKKQLYEKYEENILNQDRVISRTLRDVQEKFDQLAASNALQQANKLMQDINKAIDIDAMQDAMGNLQELEMNNDKFDELYQQYVGLGTQEIENQVNQMEADMFKSDLRQHEQNTQKPNISQSQNNQQYKPQQQQQNQQQQQKQQKQRDEIDDQLAMLA